MPALTLFNRKFRYASDDLLVPSSYFALIHSIFLVVSSVSLPQVPEECGSRHAGIVKYFQICSGVFAIKLVLDILTALFSLRGTIANDTPRRPIPYFIYLWLALHALETVMHMNGLFMNTINGPCSMDYPVFNSSHNMVVGAFFFFNLIHWISFFLSLVTSKPMTNKSGSAKEVHDSANMASMVADKEAKNFFAGLFNSKNESISASTANLATVESIGTAGSSTIKGSAEGKKGLLQSLFKSKVKAAETVQAADIESGKSNKGFMARFFKFSTSSTKSQENKSPSLIYQPNEGRKGFWAWLFSPFFCLPRFIPGAKHPSTLIDASNASLSTLAEATARLFGDDDLVASDIAAGLVLVKRRQEYAASCLERKGSTVSASTVATALSRTSLIKGQNNEEIDEQADVSDDEEQNTVVLMAPLSSAQNEIDFHANPVPQDASRRLSDIVHFMRYAEAMYGRPMHLFDNFSGGCKSLCLPCLDKPALTPYESARRTMDHSWTASAFCCTPAACQPGRGNHTDIMYMSRKNGFFTSPYMIALDHERQSIVIAIRGGMSLADIATELQYLPSPVEFIRENGERGFFFTHGGMWEASQQLHKDIVEQNVLDELCLDSTSPFKSYRIVVVGHGLASGIAALLGHIIRSHHGYQEKSVQSYCFGALGCVTSESGRAYLREYCTSVVLADDMSPAANARNMYMLMKQIRQELISSDNVRKVDLLADCTVKKWFSRNKEQQKTQIPLTHGSTSTTLHDNNELKMYAPGYLVHFVREEYTATVPKKSKRSYLLNEYQPVWKDPSDFKEILVKKNMLLDRLPNRLLHVLNTWAQTSGAHIIDADMASRHSSIDKLGLKSTPPMIAINESEPMSPEEYNAAGYHSGNKVKLSHVGMPTSGADARVPVLSVISAYASVHSANESQYDDLRIETSSRPDSQSIRENPYSAASDFPLETLVNMVDSPVSSVAPSVRDSTRSSVSTANKVFESHGGPLASPETKAPSIPLPPSPVAHRARIRDSDGTEPKRQSARTMLQRLASRLKDLKAATQALQQETHHKSKQEEADHGDKKEESPKNLESNDAVGKTVGPSSPRPSSRNSHISESAKNRFSDEGVVTSPESPNEPQEGPRNA